MKRAINFIVAPITCAGIAVEAASVKAATRHAASDSDLPGQFGLVGLLAVSESEKARIAS